MKHSAVQDVEKISPKLAAHVDLKRIEKAVREILLAVGEDPDREGLLKTPNRVARAYGELMAGLQDDPQAAPQDRLPRALRRGRAAARHRVPLAVRAPPAAVHRPGARRVPAGRQGRRPEQAGAARRGLRAPAAGAGAADDADRRRADGGAATRSGRRA